MGPDASLTPELIQAQSFTSTFRGFDQAEVRSFLNRVAADVRAWKERAEQLESAWHSAEERAARPPVLDEDTLMAAVGEETASILRTARAAAADMRAKAAEESDRQLSEAREEADRLVTEARSEAERLLRETHSEVEKQRSDAHSESEKLLGEAREESDRLLGEARSGAERLRTAAEDAAARTAAGAEDAAARLMSGARSEASEILEKARTEAEAMRAAAEKDRQLTIEGANTTRDRILEDLSRRKRIATVQIEQLRAGRERLIESYAVVRRTLEEVSAELSRADAEARAAADDVGRRMAEVPDAVLGDPAEIGVEPAVALLGGEPSLDEGRAGGEAPGDEHEEPADEAQPVDDQDDQDELVEEAQPVGEAELVEEVAPVEDAVVAEQAEPVQDRDDAGSGMGAAGTGAEAAEGAEDIPESRPGPEAVSVADTPAPAGGEPAKRGKTEKPAQKAAAARPRRTRSRTKPAETAAEEPADPAPAAAVEPAGSAVDELFARIRGTRADEAPPAGEAGDAGEAGAEEEPVRADGSDEYDDSEEGLPLSDADEALLQKRESAVVDLEVTLTRRLKRALQDEQNDVLDRLRNLKGAPSAGQLLAEPAEQTARYEEAARPLLLEAASAGAEFAVDALGADVAIATNGAGTRIDDLAGETGTGIVGPLRRRLEQAIERNAGEDQAVLIESLGAAYREWKTQRIERLAGDMLSAAFSRGTWDATPDGVALRWIVEDADGPCPDCDDDALAGELPKGEPFPTGQNHPPAHSGCRCLLVPGPSAD